MSDDSSLRLQTLLDRANHGEDAARRELINAAYDRLLILTRHIFHKDFAYLHHRHNTQSVLHEAILRLLRTSSERVQWNTAAEFFRFSAVLIRRELIDLLRHHRTRAREQAVGWTEEGTEVSEAAPPVAANADPVDAAMWTEFHEKVMELPEEERAVVDLYWYHGLSQAEIASLLGIHEKAVSRRWLSARLRLADWIPGWERLAAKQG